MTGKMSTEEFDERRVALLIMQAEVKAKIKSEFDERRSAFEAKVESELDELKAFAADLNAYHRELKAFKAEIAEDQAKMMREFEDMAARLGIPFALPPIDPPPAMN